MSFDKTKLKNFGLGLGLRKELRTSILDFFKKDPNNDLLQWVEVVPENHIYKGGKPWDDFMEVVDAGIPVIPHGVSLSIATAPKPGEKASHDPRLVGALKELFKVINPPWFSDHISLTRVDDTYIEDLIPVPQTREMANIIADNVKFLQDELQLPFLIENPSYYSTIIEQELKEYDFINLILEKADCGLLLDVNNIYVNSVNHDYDPYEFLDRVDVNRATQVHIAGHLNDYKAASGKILKILDTHGADIIQEVYDILDALLKKTTINAILLERDFNFPSFEELTNELKLIREVMNRNELVTR